MDIEKVYAQFNAWLLSGMGSRVLAKEQEITTSYLDSLQPSRFIQLGGFSLVTEHLPESLHFMHLNQPKEKFPVGQNVISDFLMLPFKESSIDLIICPHLHEMVSRPEQLYAELSRITVAGGILIMFSLNTKSIWSMQRLLRGNKILPWCHLMCSQEKLSLSLRAHDFMLIRKQSLYHMPYVENNIGKKLLGLVGNFGERWWSSFGAINVAVYKKMELIGAIESAEQPLPHTH